MKVEVELTPDIGAALMERARSAGLPLDQFAARTLSALATTELPSRNASPEERLRSLDDFLAGLESDTTLPEEAFQRENWYPDRWQVNGLPR